MMNIDKIMEVTWMFNENISRRFKIAYFVSSFTLSYLFLIIIMYVQYWEVSGNIIPDFYGRLTPKKISFIMLIVMFLFSFCELFYVKHKISEGKKFLRNNGYSGELEYTYNSGSREFILGVLLPVVTTISVPDTPITGIVGVLLIQFILGYFFWNSNELFVNVPLIMFGYSLVNGKKDNQDLLLFISNPELRKLLGKKVIFVYLGKIGDSNIGIVGKEELDA